MEEGEYSASEAHYQDWYSDNRFELLKEFAEENEPQFNEYCRKRFKQRD